jgi:hypothetical protein
MTPYLVTYAQVVLHSGCAITGNKHNLDRCPDKLFYLRIARKHAHWLKSNGIYIGPLCDKHG